MEDCFNTIMWNVFRDCHGKDTDSLRVCYGYINFCVENTVPVKECMLFLQQQNSAVQRELWQRIREGKDRYRRKMEEQLKKIPPVEFGGA